MCGIVCVIGHKDRDVTNGGESPVRDTRATLQHELELGLDYIKHRGPDGTGVWISADQRIGLAHCRLAINDLRPSAAQPLHSPDGRVHAVVNGEIYDFNRLREELASIHSFRTKTDSEVVVALYLAHGLPGFLEHLRGEFALCIYDERKRTFIAARDRFGIKPLFWTKHKGRLLFAAEVKAFLGLGWQADWDVQSLSEGGWNFDDRTVFHGVKKIRPGHHMTYHLDTETLEETPYWDLAYPSKSHVEDRTEQEMIQGVRERMVDAVRLRLRADVPIGIYLSGGIDSSTLAGIATHLVRKEGLTMGSEDAKTRIRCFSIAFEESSGFDESAIAERTAEWLEVEHTKILMGETALAERFEDATWHCEQHNHGDLNYVGKFALSAAVRDTKYKVVLTGEGADEHFAGYPMFMPDFLREKDQSWPGSSLSEVKRKEMYQTADQSVMNYYSSIGANWRKLDNDEECDKVKDISTATSMCAFHFDLFARWVTDHYPREPQVTIERDIKDETLTKIAHDWHPLHSALYVWGKGHLANNFLTCLGDRGEMAHTVEARPPLLDHHLSSYVNDLPPSMKIRYDVGKDDFTEKWIQREAARSFITTELYKRKKHPYSAPTSYPVGGPMHRLFKGLLSREKVMDLGFVDWEQCSTLVAHAFEEGIPKAMRTCIVLGQWIVLADRFGIPTARPITD